MAAIGIDFGNTYCRVGVFQNNQFEIIPSETQSRQTPCYVSFKCKRDTIVGDLAQARFLDNMETTFFCPKRLIGRSYEELTRQIANNHWPFVVKDGEKRPVLQVAYTGEKEDVNPIQVYSAILRKARELATEFLQENVVRAVITIPTKCSVSFIEDAIESVKMAGFVEVKLIEKPLSAALAHTTKRNLDYVMAVHLGGGSLGVSVVKMSADSILPIFSDGDPDVGGVNIDAAMVTWLCRELNIPEDQSIKTLMRLSNLCESAKKNLSSCSETSIKVGKTNITITRNHMMEMEDVNKILEKFKSFMKKAVAAIPSGSIERTAVVLVGGNTRLKCVQDAVNSFGIKQNRILSAEEVAVIGAASLASKLWPLQNCEHNVVSNLINLPIINWNKTEHSVTNGFQACQVTTDVATNVDDQSKDLADRNALLNDMESNIYAILRVIDGLHTNSREYYAKECKKTMDWLKGDPVPVMRDIMEVKDGVDRLKSSVDKEVSVSQQQQSFSRPGVLQQQLLELSNDHTKGGTTKKQPAKKVQLMAAHQSNERQQQDLTYEECCKQYEQLEKDSIQHLDFLQMNLKKMASYQDLKLKLQHIPMQVEKQRLQTMHDDNEKCLTLLSQQQQSIEFVAWYVQRQYIYSAEQESLLHNTFSCELQQLRLRNDECKNVLETQQRSAIRVMHENISKLF